MVRSRYHPAGLRISARVRGFTYLGLLFLIVLMGIMLSAAGLIWHTEARRERELQLLFVGEQYRQAIDSYYAIPVNGSKRLPASIDELLEDHRFPMPVRHLRKRFFDPVTNSPEWGLIRKGDRIAGVFSLSQEAPLKKADFGSCCAGFEKAQTYSEWKFVGGGDINQNPQADTFGLSR